MKNSWITIKNIEDLPKDKSFIALWKGRICVAQYCEDQGRFFICFDPAEYEGSWKLDKQRNFKFTHFIPLEWPASYPEDYVKD